MEDKFFEEIEKLDFENVPESQRLVNVHNWVENTTHGEITDLLIPGSITKNTKLAITNAAYKFKLEETKKEIFYVSNERQEFVDMMHVEGTFNHAANEKHGCCILELPYTGQDEASRVSMALFPRPVDMKTVLGRGMGKLFENSANFSGFSKKVQVGEVLVKFKITVNEEGVLLGLGFFVMNNKSVCKKQEPVVDSRERPLVTFELKFSNVRRNNDGKHSSVMRPDSKQECLLKGFDLDSRKPEQWIGDS
ncbi:serpin 9 [Culex quinquefasciatus]|uniref:Serpin 9 n=1 Tax=Culex quinquefasciatus TaxID=7176 RepID=B0X7I7_CULQU|nr:serpin 9 [Culex quinquefasciatus]|eukprot:XP_001865609.1 serpin 9 [Culex quinquefasciatus]